MCKEATVYTHVTMDDQKSEDKNIITVENDQSDEESKMLCNVIVQATYELHTNEHKNRDDIQVFLKNDCQKLPNNELINKVKIKIFFKIEKKRKMKLLFQCNNFVEKHGITIHGHVASNIVSTYKKDFWSNKTYRYCLGIIKNL